MKKTKAFSLLLFLSKFVSAQIGIGTEVPQSSLDVNGNIMLRKELKVGGSKTTDGNAGNYNDILVSQGDGSAPLWKNAKVGFYEDGEYRTTSSFINTSENGLLFDINSNDGILTSSLGELLVSTSSKWKELSPDLSTKFTVDDPKNKINIMFQTGIESGNTGNATNQNIKFMCGIFVDNVLVALRADQIDGIPGKGASNQSIYTLNYTVNDVTTGEHTLKVGCRRISTTGTNVDLVIGRALNASTVTNNFMLQSVLKFDVNELVKVTR
ncbi:hypothetical protein N5J53_15280 [Empedobacter sp. GD03644]|uniref:hypothetical protein n=1 Tax=Empedobacter sp. GD03644 TaxID=2975358 RepID=UPI0024488240|nr:hypothetical protein [Empedobacter sp. GD03644]MDH2208371.1 hypothetical protein [Empedobacter sp. GD03644]